MILLHVFLAFLLTVFFIILFRKYACHYGLIDSPGGRKKHDGVVPVIGGLAIFGGFVVSSFLQGFYLNQYYAFFSGLFLLVLTGTIDDIYDLTARVRFFVQIFVALLMTSWGGVYLDNLGDLFGFGPVMLNNWAIPFTVFAVLGVINAFNMIDGVDGLAGGAVLIALLMLGVIALSQGLVIQTTLLFLMAGSLAAFLYFNIRTPWRNKAIVFMGDAGSMMLGFTLIWFAVDLSDSNSPILTPITAVWILAVPIMDTVSTMFRRMLKGKSPFVADREHLHHIFLRAGYSVSETVAIILFSALVFAMIGLAGWYYQVSEYVMCYSFIVLFLCHFMIMHHAWRFTKTLKKINRRRHLVKVIKKKSV